MQTEPRSVDITNPEALARAAEEVERTRRPRVITRGQHQIALLAPLKPVHARRRGRALTRSDSLFSVVGKAHIEDADAVVDNVDAYLAQDYHAELDAPPSR